VVGHHKDWSGEVVAVLRARLSAPEIAADEFDTLREALLAFCQDPKLQKMVADLIGNPALNTDRRLFLLDVMNRCTMRVFPPVWIQRLGELLKGGEVRLRMRAIEIIATRNLKSMDKDLMEINAEPNLPAILRLATLSALSRHQTELADNDFSFLLDQFKPGTDLTMRTSAAHILSKTKLSDEQLIRVAKGPMSEADALTLPGMLDSFREAKSAAVGQEMVSALLKTKANLDFPGNGGLEHLLRGFPDEVRTAAKPLLARIKVQQAARGHRLDELEPLLSGGDVGRGRRVFFGQKAGCSSCHAIGSEGGTLAPDLTSIGSIRSGRDILEAIVFPSASFVPGYEPFRVETKEESYNGLIANQTPEAIVLRTAANAEMRIQRDTILSITPGTVSIMPEGLDTALTQPELLDLLAFLQAQNGNEFLETHKIQKGQGK
jgi:putative heme-binding domain-containing protein